jgi:beta-lactamase regulating signal transducer with metallopeptidase domain
MLEWFAETTLVAGVLALVAVAASRLRHVGPSVRHALWLVVLIKLITPPLVAWPWAADWRSLSWLSAPTRVIDTADPDREDRPVIVASASVEEAFPADDNSELDPQPIEIDAEAPVALVTSSEPTPHAAVTELAAKAPTHATGSWWPSLPSSALISRPLLFVWLIISIVVAAGQSVRIMRFSRRLHGAVEAPDDLIDEADQIGRWLGVRVPEILVVENLGTPLLWCLGKPQLLLPARLVKTLPFDRWRGILTHELAHLRRRDHWVCRLELAAGLIWWWNPLYWLARARLDAEAELACDAWVVWALPKDRLSYAEVLFDICSTMSLARPMAPTLGVAGSGRFFERRLTMILQNNVPRRLSPLGLAAACFLVLLAMPSWSAAKLVCFDPDIKLTATAADMGPSERSVLAFDDDDKDKEALKRQAENDKDDDADEDDDGADDDDDDDDDSDMAAAGALAKAMAAKVGAAALCAWAEDLAWRAMARASEAKARASEAKAQKPARDRDRSVNEKESEEKSGPGSDFEKQMEELGEKIGKEIEGKFGPDFEKQMEELGEKIGKEIEGKFGPDFEKKMEAFGKGIEEKFGPEFEKKMEAFGKEIERKLGPGSEFAKKMEAFGKEMEAKFGPGSDFEKKMKSVGDEMNSKYGPGSDFAKKMQERAARPDDSDAKAGAKAGVKPIRRETRIKELEAQIAKLMAEIESLKASGDDRNRD